MTTARARTLLAVASLGAFALSACSSGDAEESTSTTTSTQATATTASTSESADAPSPTPPADPTTNSNTDPATAETTPAESELEYADVGSKVTIQGEPATVCIFGDGFGTNVWAGNKNANCDMVSSTYESLTIGLNPTEDNVRERLPLESSLVSPELDAPAELKCAKVDDVLIKCSGGDGMTIWAY